MEQKTQRPTLKPLSDTDRSEMEKILTNDIVKRTYMLPDFSAPEEVAALFEQLKAYSHCRGHYIRGIYLGSRLIGLINDVEIHGSTVELGWAIHPDYHNCGYATQAVKAAIADLFCLGFQEITAGAFVGNIASFRVMEKAGMQLTPRQDEVQYRGKTYRCKYYSIQNTSHQE